MHYPSPYVNYNKVFRVRLKNNNNSVYNLCFKFFALASSADQMLCKLFRETTEQIIKLSFSIWLTTDFSQYLFHFSQYIYIFYVMKSYLALCIVDKFTKSCKKNIYIKYYIYTHTYMCVCMYSPRVCLQKTSVISSDNRDSPQLCCLTFCCNHLFFPVRAHHLDISNLLHCLCADSVDALNSQS